MEFRIYKLEDESRLREVCELFSMGLGGTTEAYWKWRIFTPNGQEQPEAIVAENEQGSFVGVCSVLPMIYGNNKEWKCSKLCDWVIHPEYRGLGLAGKLLRYLFDHYSLLEYDFMIEYPNDNSYPIFKKYGFTEKERIGSWDTKKRLLSIKRHVETLSWEGIEYRFSDVCPISEFCQRPDRMYRTPEFMRWKFDQNPSVNFRWLSVWDKERLIGYFVFTCTKGRLRIAVNVYDWEFDSGSKKEFSTAIQLLNRLGNYVSIWGRFGEREQSLLRSGGLEPSPATTRLMLKALSEKGYPEPLTLTRLDTDY